MTVWTVKGGRHGEREDRLLENGLIGGGWEHLPSLADVRSKSELDELYSSAYPGAGKQTRGNYVGQLWSLVNRMAAGDLVVMPLKTTGTVAVGHIVGPYHFRTDLGDDLRHVRSVQWDATDVPRDAFDQDLLYSFGAFLTFGQVRREGAAERIRLAIDRRDPRVSVGRDDDAVPGGAELEEEPDIESWAREQVRQHVSQRFVGDDLARLVGAILGTEGYMSVRVSPPGADRGVDILAGSGPLGLASPRLVVQVKTGQAGVDEFRSLKGVMDSFRADQGLLVGWRGFKGTVRAEASQSHFSVRLWDADDLLEELFGVYEWLPEDVRAELPLKRVWALAILSE